MNRKLKQRKTCGNAKSQNFLNMNIKLAEQSDSKRSKAFELKNSQIFDDVGSIQQKDSTDALKPNLHNSFNVASLNSFLKQRQQR
jgi:hypothetical protein